MDLDEHADSEAINIDPWLCSSTLLVMENLSIDAKRAWDIAW